MKIKGDSEQSAWLARSKCKTGEEVPKRHAHPSAAQTPNSPGVDVDFQYRDPWGNPYIISLEANCDGFVREALCAAPHLFPQNSKTTLKNFNGLYEWRGRIRIWFRGPEAKASFAVPAKSGVNKDNVVSWE
jgi:hypothetical protein